MADGSKCIYIYKYDLRSASVALLASFSFSKRSILRWSAFSSFTASCCSSTSFEYLQISKVQ